MLKLSDVTQQFLCLILPLINISVWGWSRQILIKYVGRGRDPVHEHVTNIHGTTGYLNNRITENHYSGTET